MRIDFDTAYVFFDCATCNGTGEQRMSRHDPDPDWCSECGGSGCHPVYIGAWLRNLANAAALCMAFRLGEHSGFMHSLPKYDPENGLRPWEPNVEGKVAPSHEGSE